MACRSNTSTLVSLWFLSRIRKATIGILFFTGLFAHAQLIGNPGFESFTPPAPTTYSQISKATGWTNPLGGFAGTPDYFNTQGTFNLSDRIAPNRGYGIAGGFVEFRSSSVGATDYKEYMTRKLSGPLQAGATYLLSFHIAHLYGGATVSYNQPSSVTFHDLPSAEQGFLGAVFSTTSPVAANTVGVSSPRWTSIKDGFGVGRTLIPATNTDVYGPASRNQWVKVTLEYTAVGTEEYITIGQFRPGPTSLPSDFNGAYYLYDDFSLNEVCTQPGLFDTAGEASMTGISDLDGFANGWPENVPNGYIVMESRNSGLVITRVTASSSIVNPVEGMLVYDITDHCVKLYNGTVWNCLERSCNK